ncbi:beta strand repeat-containing protein [Magnetococcales bacterium HHB-1]
MTGNGNLSINSNATTLTLTGNNSGYTGATTLTDNSSLEIATDSSIGTGTLLLGNQTTLLLNNDSLDNNIQLNGDTTFQTDHNITLSGTVSGNGQITKTGMAILAITGDLQNIDLNLLNGRTYLDTLIPLEGHLTLSSNATLQLISSGELDAISGSGAVNLDHFTLTLSGNNDSTFSGTLTGADGAQLIKNGQSKFDLLGDSTFTGHNQSLLVNSGLVAINGKFTSTGGIQIATGGTLGGNGVIDATVTIGGFLNPGNSPGVLTIRDLIMQSGSTFTVEITGEASLNGQDTAGVNYDQVIITNSVDLGGASLNPVISAMPNDLDQLTIIDLQSSNSVNDTFAFQKENSTLSINQRALQVSYIRGDGNDVQLIVNDHPSGSIPNDQTTAYFDYTYDILKFFQDNDHGDVLTYSSDTIPDGLALDATTGLLSGKPTSIGESTVTITATDLHGLSTSSAFMLRTSPTVVDPFDYNQGASKQHAFELDYSAAKFELYYDIDIAIAEQYAQKNDMLTGFQNTQSAHQQVGHEILGSTVEGQDVGKRYEATHAFSQSDNPSKSIFQTATTIFNSDVVSGNSNVNEVLGTSSISSWTDTTNAGININRIFDHDVSNVTAPDIAATVSDNTTVDHNTAVIDTANAFTNNDTAESRAAISNQDSTIQSATEFQPSSENSNDIEVITDQEEEDTDNTNNNLETIAPGQNQNNSSAEDQQTQHLPGRMSFTQQLAMVSQAQSGIEGEKTLLDALRAIV